MKKGTYNYILFVVMLLMGLIQAVSGFLLWLVIPGGHRGFGGVLSGGGEFLWSRYTWIEIHDWTAVILVIIIIIHVIIHWKWISVMTGKMLGQNNRMEK